MNEATFTVGPDINNVRNVRGQSGSILGILRDGAFEPTSFPQEWGMDRAGIIHAYQRALDGGRVLF